VCDAIQATTPVLEYLEDDIITKIFIPQLLVFFNIKQHTTKEITHAIAKNIGSIAYTLQKRKFLGQFQSEFMNFYKEIIFHKELDIRIIGVYNLPCFHLLYKDIQEQSEIDFSQIYQTCLQDDFKIRKRAAKSLHEVFLML
jgi:hypothetical protein